MLMAVKKSSTEHKPAKLKAARSRAQDGVAGTREALIRGAMKLYGERSIGAVSLREIVQKAGQANQSAIHYHFNDRQGLIAAIADFVHKLFEPHFNASLAMIAERERGGSLSKEDLVEALVIPLIRVFHTDETGRDAIRFIARLAADGDDAGQALLLKQVASFLVPIEARLALQMPDKPRDKLQLQLLLGLSSTVYGLTVIGTLRHAPFSGGVPLYTGRFDDLIRDYVHFVGRGVLGA